MINGDVKHWLSQISFTNVLTIVVMIGAIFAFFFSRERTSSAATTNLATLTAIVATMNEKGTNRSQLIDQGQADAIESNRRRIEGLEANFKQQTEVLNEVRGQLRVIAALLEGKKQ